jgi:hypothetical protein
VLAELDTEGRHAHLFVNSQTGEAYRTIAKVWLRLRQYIELEASSRSCYKADMPECSRSFIVRNPLTLLNFYSLFHTLQRNVFAYLTAACEATLRGEAAHSLLPISDQ